MFGSRSTRLTVVVGGQFGSEGKGAVVERLSRAATDVIRVGGPNAGHVIEDQEGRRFKLQQVPAGALNPGCGLHIAAGSEIDVDVLEREIEELEAAGYEIRHRLYVDPQATVLEQVHAYAEKTARMHEQIGSTGKGVGAARGERIWRRAKIAKDEPRLREYIVVDDHRLLLGSRVVLEGTQGYGLGLHAGWYPKCTSIDCRAIDMLSLAGISPWDPAISRFRVIVVARSYPIRVAGDSGPLRGETSWKELGLKEERTTVTNKVRRVGQWDPDLVAAAIQANGGGSIVTLAYTMADYVLPIGGRDGSVGSIDELPDVDLIKHLDLIQHQVGADISYIGTGPNTGIEVGW